MKTRTLIAAALLCATGCSAHHMPMAGPGDQDKLNASSSACRGEITLAHYLIPGLDSAETIKSCMRDLGWEKEPGTLRTWRWVGR